MSTRTLYRLAGIAAAGTAAFTAGRLRGLREAHVDVPQPGEPPRSYGVTYRPHCAARDVTEPVTGGSLERALWAAGRLRAGGWHRVRVVPLSQKEAQQ